jgi:AcrR family transcriptional regulator
MDIRPAAAPRRKRRGRYHHGDLRQALADEALRAIAAGGVEAVTLRGVGEALGVSRTALYRHFSDKESLLATVATEGFRRLRAALVEAWQTAGRGRAGFEAMGVAYVRFATANPAHYRVMFGRFVAGASAFPELEAEGAAAFQVLVDSLVEQQHDGIVIDGDPARLGRFVWSAVHGVAMLAIDGRLGPASAIEALAAFTVRQLRFGIGRDADTAPARPHRRSAAAPRRRRAGKAS